MYKITVNIICVTPCLLAWRSLLQSVTGMDDYCTNQSDYDTPTQEESEPRSTSGKARSDCVVHSNKTTESFKGH